MPWHTRRMSGSRGNIARFNQQVVVPWYKDTSIARPPVAIYQPLGAESYAASKVNLINPGVFDLSDGADYPLWSETIGWSFPLGPNRYLTTSAIITGTPCSMVVRFKDTAGACAIMSVCDSAARNAFLAYGDLRFNAYSATPGGIQCASSALYTDIGIGAAVYTSNVLRAAFLDGANKGTDTTDLTPTGLDVTYIGTWDNGSGITQFLRGNIYACAFYDIALSDAEVASLYTTLLAL